jgi:tetratricopeptide (TPR) repeat protein
MKKRIVCLLMLLATIAVYSPVRSFDFINYDDPDYVTENLPVREGLAANSVAWAFTTTFAANWFPLTWLSHMTDVELFGMQSGRHHLTNVFLPVLTTLLLFTLMARLTDSLWKSAFVAAAFALHPLHVESVAWIVITWHTVPFWQNSLSLFRHALQVTSGNYVAHLNLGEALRRTGRREEAVDHFQAAIAIRPALSEAHNNLGEILLSLHRTDEAAPHLEEAIRLQPDSAEARLNMGALFLRRARYDEAAAQYREALRLKPDYTEAHCGIGVCLSQKADQLEKALRSGNCSGSRG